MNTSKENYLVHDKIRNLYVTIPSFSEKVPLSVVHRLFIFHNVCYQLGSPSLKRSHQTHHYVFLLRRIDLVDLTPFHYDRPSFNAPR